MAHFGIIGMNPAGLRGYYGELPGGKFSSSPVSGAVSEGNLISLAAAA
jgi:hypothetical protein